MSEEQQIDQPADDATAAGPGADEVARLSLNLKALPPPRRAVTATIALFLAVALAMLWLLADRAGSSDIGPDGQLVSTSERAAIMTRVAQMTEQVMSYRSDQAEADIKAAKELMTPRMQEDYDKSLPSEAEREAQQGQGIVVNAVVASLRTSQVEGDCTPDVCAVSLLSATEDEATALVFVNQTATAKGQENAVNSPTWEVVTVVKQDGKWLIDKMESP